LLSAKIKIIYQYNFDTSSQEIAFFFEIWGKITMIWQLYRIWQKNEKFPQNIANFNQNSKFGIVQNYLIYKRLHYSNKRIRGSMGVREGKN
jgi:hypothetical protein